MLHGRALWGRIQPQSLLHVLPGSKAIVWCVLCFIFPRDHLLRCELQLGAMGRGGCDPRGVEAAGELSAACGQGLRGTVAVVSGLVAHLLSPAVRTACGLLQSPLGRLCVDAIFVFHEETTNAVLYPVLQRPLEHSPHARGRHLVHSVSSAGCCLLRTLSGALQAGDGFSPRCPVPPGNI